MPFRSLQGVSVLVLAVTLAGCSMSHPRESSTADGYCLRAGGDKAFDCSAPALPIPEVRDPLAPSNRFSDEELMDLLAEIKRWLARRRLSLQGEAVPPELQPDNTTPTMPSDLARPASLPRPWALILNDFSAQSLQRTISDQP